MPDNHPIKELPSQAYLLACFIYNGDTGALEWRNRPREHFASAQAWPSWNTRFACKLAGCTHKDGHRQIILNGVFYKAHRIIWKMVTGQEPPTTIDHKDGNRGNNRWDNLRPANETQQKWNTGLSSRNRSGYRGASWDAERGKWVAHATNRFIGRYATLEEAAEAADAERRRLAGEFYRAP